MTQALYANINNKIKKKRKKHGLKVKKKKKEFSGLPSSHSKL
jgi:hypothetical protein